MASKRTPARAPARKRAEPPTDPPELHQPDRSTVAMPVAVHRYRVLFSCGHAMDVLAIDASSTMRGWALEAHYLTRKLPDRARIEGVADLGVMYTHTPDVLGNEP